MSFTTNGGRVVGNTTNFYEFFYEFVYAFLIEHQQKVWRDIGVLASASFDSIGNTTLTAQTPACDPTGPHFSTRQHHHDFAADKRVCGAQKLQSHPLAPEQRRMSFFPIMGCSATLISLIFKCLFCSFFFGPPKIRRSSDSSI